MQVTLYNQQGNSDKVYIIECVPAHGGFMVNFAYGRRGSTLTTGSKTVSPVSETKAHEIFNKLRGEKMAKGYYEGAQLSGYAYSTASAGTSSSPAPTNTNPANAPSQQTGISVQLLTPIDDTELENFFIDDSFIAQEKHDGRRVVLVLDGGEIYGVNLSGLRCGIPLTFATAVRGIADLCKKVFNTEILQIILDGEAIGDDFFAFDLLELNGEDLRSQAYLQRYLRLKAIINGGQAKSPVPNIFCSDLFRGEAAKREFFASAQARNLEGVVFKLSGAKYEAGKPSSGGSQRKYKFWADATCLVAGQNGSTRSVALQVLRDDGSLYDVGNCAIPRNFDVPKFGTLVEIRYLYAFPNGSLYQPVYEGERTDKTTPDTYKSLKFKAQTSKAA